MSLALILSALSAVWALMAALYWFRSAKVQLPTEFPLAVISHRHLERVIGSEIVSSGSSPEIDSLGKALIEQGKLNAKAAGWASAAALFQASALLGSSQIIPSAAHGTEGLVMAIKRLPSFDPKSFLAKVGEGRSIDRYSKDQIVFLQGDPADSVF
jgi:hypothetical protein